jgi:hypothetical protein
MATENWKKGLEIDNYLTFIFLTSGDWNFSNFSLDF